MKSGLEARRGLLLLNLGTPASPEPHDVGEYLEEFLMDPLVVDIPVVARWLLVKFIVSRRKYASASLYQKVWTKEGSPLLVNSIGHLEEVKKLLNGKVEVALGMRYGKPSIQDAVTELLDKGVEKLTVFPLYPQYSLAATLSSLREVERVLKVLGRKIPVEDIKPFYAREEYLSAVTEISAPYVRSKPYDMVLFSFHGLPERQVKKTDPTGAHCLKSETCCDVAVDANRDCYRHQCYQTARALAERLHINPLRYAVCFQSRLGRTPWIQPFTDEFYRMLPQRGIKRLLVLCPSFVADCLETLEEVQLRGKDEFLRHGGQDLLLVPSLNVSPVWAKAVVDISGVLT